MLQPKTLLLTGFFAAVLFVFVKCTDSDASADDVRGTAYAGSKACITCHQTVAAAYAHHPHAITSSPSTYAALKKLPLPDSPFYFQDAGYIQVEDSSGQFHQSYFEGGQKVLSYPFDIAFGSGEKAQTFASWQQDKLLQLPLTYVAGSHAWLSSPGFPISHVRLNRVIDSRCFECHASFIGKEVVQSGPVSVSERLDKNALVYSIDCERCHGPAAAHVQYQQEHPEVKQAKFIIRISSLTRQQQLDACAVCHSGSDLTTQRSLFSFVPGDTLSHFYYPEFEMSRSEPDVHGKQMQLLASSKCFQKSNLTCNTCHDAHASTPDNMDPFISKCMSCHQASAHAANMLTAQQQGTATGNCITCHMPLQSSTAISFQTLQNKNAYLLRTHKIAIYP